MFKTLLKVQRFSDDSESEILSVCSLMAFRSSFCTTMNFIRFGIASIIEINVKSTESLISTAEFSASSLSTTKSSFQILRSLIMVIYVHKFQLYQTSSQFTNKFKRRYDLWDSTSHPKEKRSATRSLKEDLKISWKRIFETAEIRNG